MVDKDVNPETNLGTAYSPVDYMSITSFPRLPEDDVMSGENTLKSRKDDDNVLSEQDTGRSVVPAGLCTFLKHIIYRGGDLIACIQQVTRWCPALHCPILSIFSVI